MFRMHRMLGLSRLLLCCLHTCPLFFNSYASPLSPPVDSPSLSIYNGTQSINSTLNATSLSASFYPIPESSIWLLFSFGFPRRSLDPVRLLNLLTKGIQQAQAGAREYGFNAPIKHPPNDPRAFYLSLYFIEVSLSGTDFHDLTWGEVGDILAGMAQYMVFGAKPYRATFKAASFDTAMLGQGFVREVVRGVNGVAQT